LARRLPIPERRLPASPVLIVLTGACIFLVVGCLQSTIFAQQTVAGLATGAVYGSLALALVLIYRATEVINFAQGEMAMATVYIAYQLIHWGFSYWEAFFTTLPIALLLGVAIQVVLIRPVQHKSVIAVAVRQSRLPRRGRRDRARGRRDDHHHAPLGPAPLGAVPVHEARSRDARVGAAARRSRTRRRARRLDARDRLGAG